MLGFFFRHYDPWVERYVVYDDGSTDGSREMLAAHPKVELRSFERTDAASFCISHQALQDEVWKESRGTADWVVVTAIDEHLHVRGQTMSDYLAAQTTCGVTILPALGFDMNHPTMPSDEGLLVARVTRGRPRIAFNKLSIFVPDRVAETGFGTGRHKATPVGDLVLPARNDIMLWHYKHLGFARNAEREARQAARLGPIDVAQGLGQHYSWSKDKLRSFWDQMERETIDLAADGFVPDRACVGPLWWSDRADITRVATRTEPTPRQTPKVSVLLKTHNHAPYIAQTIESVLSQSFQDFEIIVTDDASTDGTAAIARGFNDKRIDLAVNPRNLGISGAMNATLARARGRYFAIINSDDWMLPGRLARQVDFLEANPHVDVVASVPKIVDERGAPGEPIEDFARPLAFSDFACRTWLRTFFTAENCICAPTATIRREAYGVGTYDRRLTNLQDLDMWVRMLLAGHTFHVMAEPMSAFRIRDDHANASALRPDSRMRTRFEQSRILRHYLTLGAADFDALFGEDAVDTIGMPVRQRIGHLALRRQTPPHQLFGLETLYEAAADDEALDRLRDLTGAVDVFALDAIGAYASLNDHVDAQAREIIRLRDAAAPWHPPLLRRLRNALGGRR